MRESDDPTSQTLSRELARHGVEWATAQGLFHWRRLDERVVALDRLAVPAATFACFCSPDSASSYLLQRTTEFLIVFFYLDDVADLEQMTNSQWRSFHEELIRAVERGDPGTHHRATANWLNWYYGHVSNISSSPSTERFKRALVQYCRSLDVERKSNRLALNTDQYWAIRLENGFIEPYILYWQILLEIPSPPADLELQLEEMLEKAVRLVCIANDIGSSKKDHNTQDLNLVYIRAMELDLSVETAAESVVDEYNACVEAYRQDASVLRTTQTAGFLDLLATVVNGNVESTKALTQRYVGTASLLNRLQLV